VNTWCGGTTDIGDGSGVGNWKAMGLFGIRNRGVPGMGCGGGRAIPIGRGGGMAGLGVAGRLLNMLL